MNAAQALSAIPKAVRDPLLREYRSLIRNYAEHRWSPSELGGGRFCEIVYTILEGYAKGTYPNQPAKPRNFVVACRKLESNTGVPRSFQILIPRALPALYEVRNNRGVGHVGGDVDPNHMDATLVVSMCNWIMAELVRVFHNLSIEDAQALVDSIAERRIPLVWQSGKIKRVLDPSLSLKNQILLLICSSPESISTNDLQNWCDYNNRGYFLKLLRQMDKDRLVILSKRECEVQILPPGGIQISGLVAARIDISD